MGQSKGPDTALNKKVAFSFFYGVPAGNLKCKRYVLA